LRLKCGGSGVEGGDGGVEGGDEHVFSAPGVPLSAEPEDAPGSVSTTWPKHRPVGWRVLRSFIEFSVPSGARK
jgi:hypothetical protein